MGVTEMQSAVVGILELKENNDRLRARVTVLEEVRDRVVNCGGPYDSVLWQRENGTGSVNLKDIDALIDALSRVLPVARAALSHDGKTK